MEIPWQSEGCVLCSVIVPEHICLPNKTVVGGKKKWQIFTWLVHCAVCGVLSNTSIVWTKLKTLGFNSKGPSNLNQSCINFVMANTSFTSNHCTKQFLCPYVFQLHIAASISEPRYHKDISSIFSMSADAKYTHNIYHLLTYSTYCLCLFDTVAPWWWLQYIGETCRGTSAVLGSKTCTWKATAWNTCNIKNLCLGFKSLPLLKTKHEYLEYQSPPPHSSTVGWSVYYAVSFCAIHHPIDRCTAG
jgi:hypothetical protein